MREIKFRAWDHEDKTMLSQEDLDECPMNILSSRWYWIMQYTGLEDKNGKEIYEGDIVKTDDEYYPIMFVTYTAEVISEHDGDWDEWYCGFDLAVPNDGCKVLHYQLSDKVEVIGNIYETPELLEVRGYPNKGRKVRNETVLLQMQIRKRRR